MDNKIYGRCEFLKDWTDWDYNIHENPEQIERQGRAMRYPFTFDINNEEESGVFSSTSSLPFYNVSLKHCTCMDFESRKLPCKHIYRLAVELGYIQIIRRNSGSSFDREGLEKIKNSNDIDNEPDQLKRQKSAMGAKCAPVSIDYEQKQAIFKGSGKNPYTTTVSTCTCRDYFVRHLPCKHIYRLRHELGLINLEVNSDIYSANERIEFDKTIDIIESLSNEAQQELKGITAADWNESTVIMSPAISELLTSGIIIETDPQRHGIGPAKKRDLIDLLKRENVPFDKKALKDDLEEICLKEIPDKAMEQFGEAITVCVKKIFKVRKIYFYLHRKFDYEYFCDEDMNIYGIPLLETDLPNDDATNELIKRGYYSRDDE